MTHFEMNQETLSSVFISALIGIYWVLTSGQVLGVEVWTGDNTNRSKSNGFLKLREESDNHTIIYTIIHYKVPGKRALLLCKN